MQMNEPLYKRCRVSGLQINYMFCCNTTLRWSRREFLVSSNSLKFNVLMYRENVLKDWLVVFVVLVEYRQLIYQRPL